jgi:hypothetical protein
MKRLLLAAAFGLGVCWAGAAEAGKPILPGKTSRPVPAPQARVTVDGRLMPRIFTLQEGWNTVYTGKMGERAQVQVRQGRMVGGRVLDRRGKPILPIRCSVSAPKRATVSYRDGLGHTVVIVIIVV